MYSKKMDCIFSAFTLMDLNEVVTNYYYFCMVYNYILQNQFHPNEVFFDRWKLKILFKHAYSVL